jgi:hypothetical protein
VGGGRLPREADRRRTRQQFPGFGADAGGTRGHEDRLDRGRASRDGAASVLNRDMRVRLNEAEDRRERVEARGEFLDVGLAIDADVRARLNAKRRSELSPGGVLPPARSRSSTSC